MIKGGNLVRLDGWKVLTTHESGRIVLAVDFAQGRSAASFGDFAQLLDIGAGVAEPQVAEPAESFEPAADPARYLGPWLDGIAAHLDAVTGVVGYCAGTSFAARIADHIAEKVAREPRLIMLNPVGVSLRTLGAEFVGAVRGLGDGLTASELDDCVRYRDSVVADGAGDLVGVAWDFVAKYRTSVEATVRRYELDDEVVDELSSRFAVYLDYLLAAGTLPLESSRCRAEVLYDNTYDVEPVYSQRCVRIDVGDGSLLNDPGVAGICSAILGRRDR